MVRLERAIRPLQWAGAAAVVLWWSKWHAARIAPDHYDLSASPRLAWAVLYIVVVCVAAYAVGLPELRRTRTSRALAASAAVGVATMAVALAQLSLGSGLLPRFVLGASALVLVPWLMLTSSLADDLERGVARDRVVLVADEADALGVGSELERAAERAATMVATVDPATDGAARRLAEVCAAHGATVVVLGRDSQVSEPIVEVASELHRRGVRVRTLNQFHEEWLGKMSLPELQRIALLFDIGEIHGRTYLRVKRVVDLAVVAVGLPVLAAVGAAVAVGNLAGNRGPLLFRQERVGKDGRPFTLWKFRTMRPAGPGGPTRDRGEWTATNDPRVTPLGAVLRRTHLDELPQLLNIARGDLSIVGPRPEQVAYVEELVDKIPFYDLRHLVRPGLTGWAQVKFPYGASEQDALEKLQYDFYYLRRQSLALDVRILARTARHVIGHGGR